MAEIMEAIGVVLLCLVAAFCFAAQGYLYALSVVQRRVFEPWGENIKVGDPHFWLRSRDYGAAWDAFASALPRRRPPARQFTDAPKYDDAEIAKRCSPSPTRTDDNG